MKVTEFAIRNYPNYYEAKVKETAEKVAMQGIIRYLDQERLLHCDLCPCRFSLRNVNGKLLCPNHYNILNRTKLEVLTK